MDKKNISTKTAVKGLINGFIAYGILILFLFIVLVVLISYSINKNINSINYDILKYSLPLIGSFLAFFLIRLVCKLSTFDLFKKCQIEKDEIHKVSSKMNLFFMSLIIISVILIIMFLNIRFHNEKITIKELSNNYYSQYTEDFANHLTVELIRDFQVSRTDTLLQTIIIEIGLLLGIFSLIPTQKKLIEKSLTPF